MPGCQAGDLACIFRVPGDMPPFHREATRRALGIPVKVVGKDWQGCWVFEQPIEVRVDLWRVRIVGCKDDYLIPFRGDLSGDDAPADATKPAEPALNDLLALAPAYPVVPASLLSSLWAGSGRQVHPRAHGPGGFFFHEG